MLKCLARLSLCRPPAAAVAAPETFPFDPLHTSVISRSITSACRRSTAVRPSSAPSSRSTARRRPDRSSSSWRPRRSTPTTTTREPPAVARRAPALGRLLQCGRVPEDDLQVDAGRASPATRLRRSRATSRSRRDEARRADGRALPLQSGDGDREGALRRRCRPAKIKRSDFGMKRGIPTSATRSR